MPLSWPIHRLLTVPHAEHQSKESMFDGVSATHGAIQGLVRRDAASPSTHLQMERNPGEDRKGRPTRIEMLNWCRRKPSLDIPRSPMQLCLCVCVCLCVHHAVSCDVAHRVPAAPRSRQDICEERESVRTLVQYRCDAKGHHFVCHQVAS